MWYEILPSYLIICGILALVMKGIPPHLNNLLIDNRYRRELRYENQELTYIRDRRLLDNPYLFPTMDEFDKILDAAERMAALHNKAQDVIRDICPTVEDNLPEVDYQEENNVADENMENSEESFAESKDADDDMICTPRKK